VTPIMENSPTVLMLSSSTGLPMEDTLVPLCRPDTKQAANKQRQTVNSPWQLQAAPPCHVFASSARVQCSTTERSHGCTHCTVTIIQNDYCNTLLFNGYFPCEAWRGIVI